MMTVNTHFENAVEYCIEQTIDISIDISMIVDQFIEVNLREQEFLYCIS